MDKISIPFSIFVGNGYLQQAATELFRQNNFRFHNDIFSDDMSGHGSIVFITNPNSQNAGSEVENRVFDSALPASNEESFLQVPLVKKRRRNWNLRNKVGKLLPSVP